MNAADVVFAGMETLWQFLKVIMIIKDEVTFKAALGNLQAILTPIVPRLEEIIKQERQPRDGLHEIMEKIREGTRLVDDYLYIIFYFILRTTYKKQ